MPPVRWIDLCCPLCRGPGRLGLRTRRVVRLAAMALVGFAAAATGAAPANACRLALALGVDASRSVGPEAYDVQMQGIQAALRAPDIRSALLLPDAPVAFALYEWSGRWQQHVVIGWTMLDSPAAIDAVVAQLGAHERRFSGQTAVGRALFFGGRLLLGAPDCAARTLDLSGDGRNNDGPAPERIYARYNFGTITVNGLAIGGLEHDILDYYRDSVIRGPGAFVEYAQDWRDVPPVMHRKLLRELTVPMVSQLPGARAAQPGWRR